MNKNDLVAEVAQDAGMSKTDVTKIIDCTLERVTSTLQSGQEVRLSGFGKFFVARRKATKVPMRDGGMLDVPASNVPKFKASENLKSAVNNN
ncbi:MAG: HU family DNA-binding protein [Hyphomicrobiales bacterium]|nr:HU family DNA-binding protein [Hyphomicrobiales bacterium]MCY4033582.1 HU family DNA-binding protein [Hyphomicrobiales bacterium]MCY4039318.1 HU family DNA-binding protein [Hyphomicrobiales bacterium]